MPLNSYCPEAQSKNQNLHRHQQQNRLDVQSLDKILLPDSEKAYIASFTLPHLKEEP